MMFRAAENRSGGPRAGAGGEALPEARSTGAAAPDAPPVTREAPTADESRWVRLMGMPISVVTEAGAVGHVLGALAGGAGGWVITPNLDQLRQFRRDGELRAMYEQAYEGGGLVLADGMPLVWASRLQKTPLPQRVPGSGLIFSLTAAAAREGRSVFLLGGNPGAAEGAAAKLRELYPALRVAGTYCPPVGFEKDAAEMARIRAALAGAKPDVVYVGLGFPKQERLIVRLRPHLPGAWFLGIGVSFSFVTGEVRRAPRWMQGSGLEWVHRLTQEPGRLFKRYVIHDVPFAFRLLGHALVARFRRRGRSKR